MTLLFLSLPFYDFGFYASSIWTCLMSTTSPFFLEIWSWFFVDSNILLCGYIWNKSPHEFKLHCYVLAKRITDTNWWQTTTKNRTNWHCIFCFLVVNILQIGCLIDNMQVQCLNFSFKTTISYIIHRILKIKFSRLEQ